MFGPKCVWAQTCLSTNVLEHKRVCAQTCLCTKVLCIKGSVHKGVCAQRCLGKNVPGHKRAWSQTCLCTKVSGHKHVWAQTCVDTNVSWRVSTIVWAQACMGTVAWTPGNTATMASMRHDLNTIKTHGKKLKSISNNRLQKNQELNCVANEE